MAVKKAKAKGKPGGKRFGRRYPWEKWFAKGRVKIKLGVHYLGATHGMAQMARNAASRHGLKLHVEIGRDGKYIIIEVKESDHAEDRPAVNNGNPLFGD